jgi:hypothetical protein
MVQADGEDPIVRLLGTCILIQYEHLSANRDAWSGHLTGFSKLLDLIDEGNLLHPHPMVEQVYPWTKHVMEVKAGFWNFVVNDLEESCELRTRILLYHKANLAHSRIASSNAYRHREPRIMAQHGSLDRGRWKPQHDRQAL